MFFVETCERNIRWILPHNPRHCDLKRDLMENGVCDRRITDTFYYSKISHRILMFQAYFLNNFGKPSGKSWKDVLSFYNSTFGTPSINDKLKLHEHSKKILLVKKFDDFFDFFYMERVSPKQLTTMLRDAVTSSYKKGYNVNTNNKRRNN